MAYGIQYQFEMTNELGNDVLVNVLGNGYVGTTTTLVGGAQPVVITYNTVSDRTQGIRDSMCVLSMISQPGWTMDALYSQDERQFRVDVYMDSVLYWTGFVTQDFSTEPFQQVGTYELAVTARCGLVGLSGFKFLNQSGNYQFGSLTVTQLLALLFSSTGLTVNFAVGMNIYETTRNTANASLDQVYVNVQRFFGSDGLPMQTGDVLEALCQAFGCIVFQRSGQWWFVRQYEMPIVRTWNYSSTGAVLSGPNSSDFRQGYGSASSLKMINADQQIGYDLGWNEIKQNYNFAYLLTAIQDSFFYVWNSPTSLQYWGSTFAFGNNPIQYTTSGLTQYPFGNGAFFVNVPVGNTGSMTQYINSRTVACAKYDVINLTFECYDWSGLIAISSLPASTVPGVLFNVYIAPTLGGAL